MALNHSDLETLRTKLTSRCASIVRNYLLYIQGGGEISQGITPSQTQIDWCTTNLRNVQDLGEQMTHYCMSEPTFINSGTSITDTELQSRIEYIIRVIKMPGA